MGRGAAGYKFTRRDALACSSKLCACETRRGCENVGVSVGVGGVPGALWRVEPRPLCRRRRASERQRRGEREREGEGKGGIEQAPGAV